MDPKVGFMQFIDRSILKISAKLFLNIFLGLQFVFFFFVEFFALIWNFHKLYLHFYIHILNLYELFYLFMKVSLNSRPDFSECFFEFTFFKKKQLSLNPT